MSTERRTAYDRDGAPGPVILGGSNLIAVYLTRRLVAEGRPALVVARRPVAVAAPCAFLLLPERDAAAWRAPPGRLVVSVLPLAVLVRMLPCLEAVAGIVAIGSTSVLAKAGSPDTYDRSIAEGLAKAEADLTAWCLARGIPFTILRPTLVYDGVGDRNIARMARFIRRRRVLPIAGPARGLRQPIHADDIAKAILGALDNPAARNRVFNIAGGEVLTYRAMAERVFAAVGLKPRFFSLPAAWLETGFRIAATAGLLRRDGVGASVFRRMNEDLVFDVRPGLEVLGYAPRAFEPPRLAR